MGFEGSLFDTARWPAFDDAKTAARTVEIAVQVNGKLRARLTMDADASKDAVVAAAKGNANVARHLQGVELRKTIVVPGRLVNLVVG